MPDLPVWDPYYSEAEAPGFSQLVPASSGAGMRGLVSVVEADLSGATVSVPTGILLNAYSLGVHLTILDEATGVTGIDVGTSGAPSMYGANVGVAAGTATWCRAYSPVEFFWGADIPILLTAKGGTFTGGKVRLAAYALALTAPTS